MADTAQDAMGDAGIVTNDGALAEDMMMRGPDGGLVKHQHRIEGVSSRLDGTQMAILSAQLRPLPAWTKARRGADGIAVPRRLQPAEGPPRTVSERALRTGQDVVAARVPEITPAQQWTMIELIREF